MPAAFSRPALLGFSLLLLGGAGCGHDAPKPVKIEEVKPKVENAFKDAGPESKKMATEAVAALQQNDSLTAFVQFENLAAKSDLTPDQRDAANRSMLALMAQMQKAATNGDQKASEFLQFRRARK